VNKVERIVLNLLGIPQATIFNCKYLILPFSDDLIDIPFMKFTVREYYLKCPENKQSKIILKGDQFSFSYTLETIMFEEEE